MPEVTFTTEQLPRICATCHAYGTAGGGYCSHGLPAFPCGVCEKHEWRDEVKDLGLAKRDEEK